jgi:uncharacterized protein YdaU (DUF1376 family)
MKKTYLQHQSNSFTDIKIIKMRSKLGIESYGIFWALLELLFNEENKLCIDDYSVLAFSLQCDADKLKSVIEDFDLFIIEDGCFYSKRLNEHIDTINSKSIKAKENASKRWKNANAMQSHSEPNASRVYNSIVENSKVDKSKVNKRIVEFKNSINQIEGVNNSDKENFFLYWSELNKSGTKQKFELEKTWDLNRRLKRWSNSSFNKKEQGIKYPDYYDIHFAKRIEQDQTARLGYQKHLESIGYVKQVNTYDGKSKWVKK